MHGSFNIWFAIIVLVGIIPLTIFVYSFIWQSMYPQEVRKICYKEAGVECRAYSSGVLNKHCFYDAKRNAIKAHRYADNMKTKCFAFRSVSDNPGDCHNRFELNVDGKFTQVPCEDFYYAIQKKNSSCRDCLTKIASVGS